MPHSIRKDARMLTWYKRVYSTWLNRCFTALDYLSVAVVAFIFLLCVFLKINEEIIHGVRLILAAAVPFGIVSGARFFINSSRPYEVYDFSEFTDKCLLKKSGKSFPSRHVFSAFLIAVLAFSISPIFGIIGLIAGGVLAFCRVSLGIHFIKDVVFGAIIGVFSAIIGLLII